ncbi:hypothetical protein COY90_03820 [Candidatus Roizmanbacteria bacterium CG_4_10_14_0_8_um_filter_39_9]|uniref:Uncharacterized protein n=1 Tax=Candidatus Roizmanbacteria bacterium CG_4_10_14_0_8_um_filter_39_9 TaxID=1974829 RepID=A0A2M7QC80_9BACT|nr:MAG: hypothetical protein COY90_03820 [Candidatus Roizmanbacteria bacterium CG_4_10_14_0_8_um_filter_39_9]
MIITNKIFYNIIHIKTAFHGPKLLKTYHTRCDMFFVALSRKRKCPILDDGVLQSLFESAEIEII